MPDLAIDNDQAQFESDFREFAEGAQDREALDFARQFDEVPPASAAVEPDGATLPEKAGRAAMGAGRDIALGTIQAPRHVARGVRNAAQNVLDLADDLHNFNTNLMLGRDADIEIPDLPDIDPAVVPTITGSVIEAGTQFLTGFKGVDKIFKANKFLSQGEKALEGIKGGKAAAAAVKGALADMAVFDAQEERLSNLVQQVPALQNPVTEYLAADPEDGAAEAKFKQGLEGLAIGGIGEALFNGVRILKKGRKVRKDLQAEEIFDVPPEEKAGLGLGAKDFEFIGDPEADDFIIRRGQKISQAGDEAAGVGPEDIAGESLEENLRIAANYSMDRVLEKGSMVGGSGDRSYMLSYNQQDGTYRITPQRSAEFDPMNKLTRDQAEKELIALDRATGKKFQIPDDIRKKYSPRLPRSFEINFARIEGPEDIKAVMDQMVNDPELFESIDNARRGVRDARATLTAATDIDGFDSLMARRTGDAFNAEQVIAARQMYYDTTEKLMGAARRAAAPDASDIDQFNFRKMVAVHHAVQKEFMGVRAEAGRALQAWRIPVSGGGAENVRALEQVLNEFGGAEASKQLAKRLAAVGNNLNTAQINAITTKAAAARTLDAVSEAWTLGLLTNPTTHVVNISSNVLTGLVLGVERVGMAFVKDSPVTLREGAEYFTAFLQAQKAGMKNAAEAFRTGQTGIGISKLDLPRTRMTARDILDPDGRAGFLSQALDYYGALLSKYAGGALVAGDEYSKTVLYQAQTRALALRDGIAQGLEGRALQEHIAKVLTEPPPHIRADAVQFANYGTFTRELGTIGQAVQRSVAKQPLLRFVVPFVRTPANIFKFTFERTPLAPLAQKVRDDISAGGIRRAQALTKIGMGTTIMAIGSDMALNGRITGSGPADHDLRSALRRTGWQPYSIRIGETWYSYARFEPVATVLGMSADLAEILSNYEAYDIDAQQQADELVTAMAIAAGNQAVGKTFLRGFAELTEALSDPGRYGEGFLRRFAGSFVPAGSAAIERAVDPTMSQVFNLADQFKSRIPGLSAQVPPRRNIWGEEIKVFYPSEDIATATAERVLSLFNPVYYSAEKDAPVDQWMLKNGFNIDMPQKRQVFDGVRIDLREHPEIYDRLVTLRGAELKLMKYGNQSMKEFFENLATEEDPFGRHIGFFMALGNSYDDQQNFINQVVRDYNDAARERLLEEFPELPEIIGRERRNAAVLNSVRPSAADQEVKP